MELAAGETSLYVLASEEVRQVWPASQKVCQTSVALGDVQLLQILHLVGQQGFNTTAYPYYSRATQEAVLALMLASMLCSDGGSSAWYLDAQLLARISFGPTHCF